MVKLKRTILYSIVFTDFKHPKLHPFQNLSLGFILKISLKFRKFQLRYSYKTQYKETGCNKQYKASTMGSNNVCFLCEQFSVPIDTATQSGVEVQPHVVCKVSWKARNLKEILVTKFKILSTGCSPRKVSITETSLVTGKTRCYKVLYHNHFDYYTHV